VTHFQLILILLAVSVAGLALCRFLALPPILGYLLAGAVAGPYALGLIPNEQGTLELAEFGVVLLMFTIGLEFSFKRLRAMKRIVFGLGAMQVAFCFCLSLLGTALFGLDWRAGLALGGLLAMSSTAILSKLLVERGELDAPHGREVMGVLLFQDLAVVPLLILIPALSSSVDTLGPKLLWDFLKALFFLALIFLIGQRGMWRWISLVAQRKSSELFMLNVLLITLSLAALTQLAGLSLALGAFIAGMLISETEFRYQVEEDIKPFRDLLLGLFFISIGMMLNTPSILKSWPLVLGLLLALLIGKFAVAALASRLLGASPGVALRTGLWLCAGGEFGFVLLSETYRVGLLPFNLVQAVLAALVLSLLVTPLIVHYADHWVLRWAPSEWLLRSMQLTQVAVRSVGQEQHVIICGYGRTGSHLGRFFDSEKMSWVALETDAERVQKGANNGAPVVFGDSARREILLAAGLARARVVIISFDSVEGALRVLAAVRSVRADVPVVSRARFEEDSARLFAAGATEVIPEALESSVMLATHAMALLGIPLHRVIRRLRDLREEHYALLRGFFHGGSIAQEDDDAHLPRLQAITLDHKAQAIGRSLAELELGALGITISAVRRRHQPQLAIAPDLRLAAGDVVVVLGAQAGLDAAVERLTGST
jgi:CPA2 family monovalent cation:H+ antiporter-2